MGFKHHACQQCTMRKRELGIARQDEAHVKIMLVRVRDDDVERQTKLVAEAAEAKRRLQRAKVDLDAHEAECPVALSKAKPPPFADLSTHYNAARAELPPAVELLAMVNAGMTTAQIGEEYGCSSSTISNRLRDSGLMDKKPEPVEDEEPADVLAPLEDADWIEDGLCAQTDPEIFFPEKGGSTKEAKSICARCTVAAECLDWAIANHVRFGVWGGLSERERRQLSSTLGGAA